MKRDDRGYAMAALLVGMAVMAIMLGMAMPVWRTAVQREREAELIFRGEQYAQAIARFQGRNGGYPPSLDVLEKGRFIRKLYKDPMTGEGDFQPVYVGQMIGGQPVVPGQPGRGAQGGQAGAQQQQVQQGARAGRAGQPAAAGGGFQLPGARAGQPGQAGTIGAGPIIGVVSKSTAESLRIYNGRGRYSEWAFVAVAATQQAGAPTGAQTPGLPGRGGRGGVPPNAPGRGGVQRGGPGRGLPPGRGGMPFPGRGGPGGGNPFGPPGGLPPPGP